MKKSDVSKRRFKVMVDNQYVNFTEDIGIDAVNDKAYLPFQTVYEAMGFEVMHENGKTVARSHDTVLRFDDNANQVTIEKDGKTSVVPLKESLYEKKGITYMPPRFPAEVTNYNVSYYWDASEGSENQYRVIAITPNMPPNGMSLGTGNNEFLQMREPNTFDFSAHGLPRIDKTRVAHACEVLKKIHVVDDAFHSGEPFTFERMAGYVSNLMNGGKENAPDGLVFCKDKAILPKYAQPEAIVINSAFIEMMDNAMGYTEAGKSYDYSRLIAFAWSGGLLEGASAYGPMQYAVTSDFVALVMYNALTARLTPRKDLILTPTLADLLVDYRGFTTKLSHKVFGCDKDGEPLKTVHQWIGDVPWLAVYRDDGKPKPVVVAEHGFGSDIQSMHGIISTLAEAGFYAVTVELWGHGDRIKEEPVYHPYFTVKSIEGIDVVLDYLDKNEPQADVGALGVTGFSLGGQTTWQYAVFGNHRVTALVPMHTPNDTEEYYGYPDGVSVYYDPMGTWSWTIGCGVVYQDYTEEYITEQNRKWNPARYPERFKDVAIVYMYGETDHAMNDECFNPFMKKLKDEGIAKYCELFCMPGVDHFQTEEEIAEMVRFFEKWLK